MANVGEPTYATDVNNLDRLVWVAGAGITASSAAIGTTETPVITAPSVTFDANTAYKILVTGSVNSSVANNTPLFRLRKTNTAGQQFDTFRVPCISTATHGAHYSCYFQVGGAAVAASIVLTLTGAAGFNATMNAAATSPSSLNIYRAGSATNFAWAPTLV